MTFVTFELERWQSTWENRVRFNLSESGVHPLSVKELLELAGAPLDPLLDVRLGYSQSNGTDRLRERIAALYPGASTDQVLVTTGSAEANYVACWRILEPGDTVAMMLPNYMQIWGQTQNRGARIRGLQLDEATGWSLDPAAIADAITPGTKLVVVTNPHNPTGHILSDAARRAIVGRTAEVGAWLLADEVYSGAERNGKTTPSFWGSYDKLICVSGLSKAYGLPGLRIGWLAGPKDFVAECWARHDYTTIGPSGASDYLASVALEPRVRERILARTRAILRDNYPILERWLQGFDGTFRWTAPQAGAICFAKYAPALSGLDLVERVRAAQSVLLVPGEHFGMRGYIRFGYGNEQEELKEALALAGPELKRAFGQK
ncbi:MAG TPA: aminotransferase class I/II-fold pyridoxal phosphate-dependent enzyme [Gemmatimonadales bacterium]|nr:aminotransferase class I/II-fold pyridoxal phosphate-dependent enzyme [Gemmatimonadales bacterium]